jgi:glycosyltransferase involved in cell wall biosynthesis
MRLMQFVVDCPWPTISGGDIRNTLLGTLDGVAAYCCVGLTKPQEEQHTIPVEYHQLQCFANSNPWKNFDPHQPTCLRFSQNAFSDVEHLIDAFQPSIVVFEGVAWGAILRQLQSRRIPTVLDMHNVESLLYEEGMQSRPWYKNVWFRLHSRRWRRAVREVDRELSHLADQTWVCSADDASALHALGGVSSHQIPNPIPHESALEAPIFEDRYRNKNPLFIGHLSFFPNVAAVVELAKHGRRALARRNIIIQPLVAGRQPARAIRTLASKGLIQLIANPVSCQNLLANSGYSLLPIRQGSGTRIKVLEALAAGLVVIATHKAVEGLGLLDGIHYCHAETIDDMANRLCEFVAHPDQAAQLAQRGRDLVIENYSRTVIHHKLSTALQLLHGTRQAGMSIDRCLFRG